MSFTVLNNHAWMLPWTGDDGPWTQFLTSVSASFEVHDEGTAAQQVVQKVVGHRVLVHPVGGASFSDPGVRQAWLCGRFCCSHGSTGKGPLTWALRGPLSGRLRFFWRITCKMLGASTRFCTMQCLEKLRQVLAESRSAQIKRLRALFDSVPH